MPLEHNELALISIEKERELSLREGVRCEDNLPFLMTPSGDARAGVLLVHGFTASPWEMRLFGEALAREGYAALGVRLPGHGTTAEDLAGRRYEEWLASVERGCEILLNQGLRCYGIGMSTGALLLTLAAQRLEGMVLLSPYLRLRHRLAPAVGLLRFLKRYQRHRIPADLAPYYYDRRPLNGVYQLFRLVRRVREELPKVETPALVIISEGDRTIRQESAQELFRRLASVKKEYHCFGPEVPHILATPENPRWRDTLQLTLDFLNALEKEEGAER